MMRVDLGAVEDWAEGKGRRVTANGEEVLVVRVGNRFFAISAFCSHDDRLMDEGRVIGEATWECPHHGGRIDLQTGGPAGMPVVAPVSTYPVRVQENRLVLEVG